MRTYSLCVFVFVFKLFTVVTSQQHVTNSVTCLGPNGGRVREGTSWVADDGCNICTCTQFGAECNTWKNCANSDMLGRPGDPVCVYFQTEYYTVGQTWDTKDGCNHCVCESFGMNCTANPCKNTGFAEPKAQGDDAHVEFMDCPYKDRVYRYGDHFLADDGCNTCVCVMPGNYATFPACTTTPCDLVGRR